MLLVRFNCVSGKFLRGSDGMCGAGIYFAVSASDTFHKNQSSSAIIKIIQTRVRLGRVRGGGCFFCAVWLRTLKALFFAFVPPT